MEKTHNLSVASVSPKLQLSPKLRRKYAKHPVYGTELNYFAEKLVNQPFIKFVSRAWVLKVLFLIFLACALLFSELVSKHLENLRIDLAVLSVFGIGFICAFVLFLALARFVQNRAYSDFEVVKKKFQECGLKITKKDYYLKQADRDLNNIHNLFQLVIPAAMIIAIFVFTSFISVLLAFKCDTAEQEECFPAEQLYDLFVPEILTPVLLLSVACLLFLLSIMKIYALKTNLLIKALHELSDENIDSGAVGGVTS